MKKCRLRPSRAIGKREPHIIGANLDRVKDRLESLKVGTCGKGREKHVESKSQTD